MQDMSPPLKSKSTRAPKTGSHLRLLALVSFATVSLLLLYTSSFGSSSPKELVSIESAEEYRPLASSQDTYPNNEAFKVAPNNDAIEVKYGPKPLLEVIVGSFSDSVCVPPVRGNAKEAAKQLELPLVGIQTILPKCYYGAHQEETVDSNSRSCSGNGTGTALSWTALPPLILDRVASKVLKVLFTNRGCDEGFEGGMPSNIREEVMDLVRSEHSNDLAVLHYGSGAPQHVAKCGGTANAKDEAAHFSWFGHITEFFAPNRSVNLHMMGVDANDNSVKWGRRTAEPRLNALLANNGYSSSTSTVAHCHATRVSKNPTALHWVPSNTFNFVVVDDIDSMLPDVSSVSHKGHKQASHSRSSSDASNSICNLAKELVRVTKVGGTVWIGHITNAQHRNAFLQCAFPDCSYADSAAGGTASKRFGVSITVIRERTWLAQTGVPEAYWMKSPVSVMYRKFKLSAEAEAEGADDEPPRPKGKQIKRDSMLSL